MSDDIVIFTATREEIVAELRSLPLTVLWMCLQESVDIQVEVKNSDR